MTLSTRMQYLKPPRRYFQIYAGILELRIARWRLLVPCIAVPVSNGTSACRRAIRLFCWVRRLAAYRLALSAWLFLWLHPVFDQLNN
ncbi:hypothetical protein [Xanthomonas campestris]|uniref:hypothetical protein n=1 Tax=Xanthomonas campestris TaxID=339 RepID=UPI0012902498|nr:hypothetical protein [Xanthomonas campestris]MCC5069353.1 hypothetical protein [Xanthomonas campestris]MCC5085806.1 hypothetical protein [Xanthomonas campestris]